ncbi:hypothetical protein [Pseudomonas putida]
MTDERFQTDFSERMMPYIKNDDLDEGIKVYRYMDLAKFLSLIHQKYLFFAKASSYEDGLEGMPTQLDEFMGSGVAEHLDHVVNYLLPRFDRDIDPDALQKKNIAIAEFERRQAERTVSTVLGPVLAKDYASHSAIFEAVSEWVDVSCWHTDINGAESMAMWKIYGAGEAAVCIESTLADVVAAMEIPSDMSVHSGKVSYLDYKNEFVGIDDPLRVYFCKSKFYEFEKELRIVMYPISKSKPLARREGAGTMVKVDPRRLINSVMVSPASSSWFHDLILQVVKGAGLDAAVSKSKIPFRR